MATKVTLKNINIEAFSAFFVDINITGEKQIVDIYHENGSYTIESRGHTKSRNFVKCVEADLSTMCEEISTKKAFSHIKIPIISIKKLIELLRIYSKDTDVCMNLSCKEVEDHLVVENFDVKSPKKTTKLAMAEITLVQYIAKNTWENLVQDNAILTEFTLNEFDITDIKKLLRFESESQSDVKVKELKKFAIDFSGENSKIASFDGNWEIDLCVEGDFEGKRIFPSILITSMTNNTDYECRYVKSNSRDITYLLVSNSDLRTTFAVISEQLRK